MKNFGSTILISLILASCQKNEKPSEVREVAPQVEVVKTLELSEEQIRNAGVETGKVVEGKVVSTLELKGITALPPQSVISIHVPMGGYLKSSALQPGMYVRKGELLAVLEDPQYIQMQQDYLSYFNQMQLAEAEFNRQKMLSESKSASEKVLQQAETAYKNLVITVKALEEKLKLAGIDPTLLDSKSITGKIKITSPVNGYVLKVNANIGIYVQPTEELFELADLSGMYLLLDAFESDLPHIQPGTLLTAFNNQQPDKKIKARIKLLEKSVADDRSVKLHAAFLEPVKDLIPGTYMNATLAVQSTGNLLIPEEALVSMDNKNYVFVRQESGSFSLQEVQTGPKADGMISIRSDSSIKDKDIVLKGAYWLQMQLENQVAGEE